MGNRRASQRDPPDQTMTILGYKTVDVENIDDQFLWHIYAPTTPPGGLPIIRLHYYVIYDISTIRHDPNMMSALAACLCYIGLPNQDIIDKLWEKHPEIKDKPIHDYCTWAMTKSEWANDESIKRITGKPAVKSKSINTGKGNSSKTKKTTKKKKEENQQTKQNVKKPKPVKKPREYEESEDTVEIDDDGNEIVNDYDEPEQTDRNSEIVFEIAPTSSKRRKLNL